MSVRSTFGVLFLSVVTLLSSVELTSAQTNSQRDAVLGGVAGAIIGGIAGHQNDETPEGIAIGGVAGAIAGHVLGQSKDRNIQEQQYYQQQAIQAAHHRQQQQAIELQKAVSINDAIALSNSGVSPQLIINQIHANGVQQEIGVSEVITLHQNGVSELVINEMQQSFLGGSATIVSKPASYIEPAPYIEPTVYVEPAPVVVARPVPVPVPTVVIKSSRPAPHVYRSHRGYHHRPSHRSAAGASIYIRR